MTNFFELHKTQDFTNEFHDIYDPIIYGKNIMEIRFSLEKEWTNPKKDEKFSKYNASVGTKTYKLASWPAGIAHLAFPPVFPGLKHVMLCVKNYDENRKEIVNKNTQEVILSITETKFPNELGVTWLAQNSNMHINVENLAKSFERVPKNKRFLCQRIHFIPIQCSK